jgi:hypothetical protein
MVCRRLVMIALTLTLLLLPSMTASAHEDDTHYLLTYVICRSVGFTHDEALCVAACNVAMDDTDNLVACGSDRAGGSSIQAHVDNEWMWHAIAPCNGLGDVLQNTRDILKQKNLLFQLALDKWTVLNMDNDLMQSWKPTPPQQNVRLFWLGVFFHYQQDTWAHRRLNRKAYTRRDWESYSSPNGHVGIMDGLDTAHEQDRPPWNPMTALRNLEDGIIYARSFLMTVLNRQPNAFFTSVPLGGPGYRLEIAPWSERKDQTWKRKNRLFNQISLEAKTDAGKYLEELIRAQIDVYTNGTITSGIKTADEANLEKVFDAFATVWAKYQDKLKLGGNFPIKAVFPLTKQQRIAYRLPIRDKSTWTSNDFVRDMGGWQYALGFPTKTVDRLDVIPSPPKRTPDLESFFGAWESCSKEAPLETERGIKRPIASLLDVSPLNPKDTRSMEVLAVGSNRMLWRKSIFHTSWELVPNSSGKNGVVAARVHPDGFILGVTTDFRLQTKASLDPKDEWKVIENCSPGSVGNLTVKLDGTIVGTKPWDGQIATARLKRVPSQSDKNVPGQGKGVLSEYVLEKGWHPLPKKDVEVAALTVMPNQTSFLGVSKNGLLLCKSTLEAPWLKAPYSNAFLDKDSPEPSTCALGSVAMFPEGLLAIRRFTFELLEKRKGLVVWHCPDPDEQDN